MLHHREFELLRQPSIITYRCHVFRRLPGIRQGVRGHQTDKVTTIRRAILWPFGGGYFVCPPFL